jgi:AraC-like DNA-binding protein
MPGSFTAVFGEPDDYQAALSAAGVLTLLVTGHGQFHARLTEIGLHRLRLAAGEEETARIAALAVPAGTVLVALAVGGRKPPMWAGAEPEAAEILTAGPGERLHERTRGATRWGRIQVPQCDLAEYGCSLTGRLLAAPPGIARWRPAPTAIRTLRQLHRTAVGIARFRPDPLADDAAAHGLEQQLIHALIKCLSSATVHRETPAARRHRDLLARFEDLLAAGSLRPMADLAAGLGVSERLLRACCVVHLGMSPARYRQRHALQRVRRELRRADPAATTVAATAAQYGYADPGRFAARYRAVYGELPSATLRRSARGVGTPDFDRRRMKIL